MILHSSRGIEEKVEELGEALWQSVSGEVPSTNPRPKIPETWPRPYISAFSCISSFQ